MMYSGSYVYREKIAYEDCVIDTWGVAMCMDNGECILCSDISVEREEAVLFGEQMQDEQTEPENLRDAANDYIESLYMV